MELGGAVYHKQNRLFASLVERYNLTVVDPVHAFPFENDTTLHSDQFAVWNGNFKLISI
jgi:hypothetical protein